MEKTHSNISSQRKDDHINLAQKSAIKMWSNDSRFFYEPMLSAHPGDFDLSCEVFGKLINAPFWVSSMTGGSERAHGLNRVLAKMVYKYKIGMGLGSCRCLMDNSDRFEDFNLRPLLGEDVPFYANIGIAQLDELAIHSKKRNYFLGQLNDLDVDGLIIHVNPLQEWLQPEGDRFTRSPIETIKSFMELAPEIKVVVKEVGQGFGPKSMRALMELPIVGIEFGAFGGTNFSRLEILRSESPSHQEELALIGHSVEEMISFYNNCTDGTKDVILSGGITNFLDGHYYQQSLQGKSVIGMAGEFLKYALQGEEELDNFMIQQVEGLKFASKFLTIKGRKD